MRSAVADYLDHHLGLMDQYKQPATFLVHLEVLDNVVKQIDAASHSASEVAALSTKVCGPFPFVFYRFFQDYQSHTLFFKTPLCSKLPRCRN